MKINTNKKGKLTWLKCTLVVSVILLSAQAAFAASVTFGTGIGENEGVYGNDGITALSSGNLIQIIDAGDNGTIDLPDGSGNVTGDDTIIATGAVGDGFMFSPAGRFSINASVAGGDVVYVRAWDAADVSAANYYGNSEIITVPSDVFDGDYYNIGSGGGWDVGAGGADNEHAFETDTVKPSASITLNSPNGGDVFHGGESTAITWTNANFSDAVKIEYYDGSSWNTIESAYTNSGSYSWTVPAVNSASCLVKISDAADGDPSDTSGTFTIDSADPGVPSNVEASPSGWTNSNSFAVSWTAASDTLSGVAGYYYKVGTSAPTSNSDRTGNTTSTSLTGVTVSGNGEYTIYVWAVDNAGNADYTNYDSTSLYYDGTAPTFADAIVEPSSPTNDTSLSFSWTAASDNDSGIATGNTYYYIFDTNASTNPNTNDAGTDNTSVAVTPTASGSWYLHVAVYDNAGNRKVIHSDAVEVDFDNPTLGSVTPTDGSTNVAVATSIVVNFSEEMDADNTKISISPDPGGMSAVWNAEKTKVTYTHNDFDNETVYTVTVTGQDAVGNSLTGDTAFSFTTVAANVTTASINLTLNPAEFDIEEGETIADQTLMITNNGSGDDLNWSATLSSSVTWLSLSPSSGTNLAQDDSDSVTLNFNVDTLSAGTYTVDIDVASSDDAAVTAQSVTVTVVVNALGAAAITLNKSSLNFEANVGSSNPSGQTIKITNSGSGSELNWIATVAYNDGSGWLTIDPDTGSLSDGASEDFEVQVDIDGLAADTYVATVTVADVAGEAASQTFTVTLTVDDRLTGKFSFDVEELEFTGNANGDNPDSQAVTLSNTGTADLNYTTSVSYAGADKWLTINPSAGTVADGANESIAFSADITGLSEGVYTAEVTFSGGDYVDDQVLTVTLILDASETATGDITITNVDPSEAAIGTTITITGSNFGDSQSASYVLFTDGIDTVKVEDVEEWSDTAIQIVVPTEGLESKTYALQVYRNDLTLGVEAYSNAVAFKVIAMSTTLKAYPNPFNPLSGLLTMQVTVDEPLTAGIYVYDITGRMVYYTTQAVTAGTTNVTWNGVLFNGEYPSDGAYLIRIINEGDKALISKGKIIIVKQQ